MQSYSSLVSIFSSSASASYFLQFLICQFINISRVIPFSVPENVVLTKETSLWVNTKCVCCTVIDSSYRACGDLYSVQGWKTFWVGSTLSKRNLHKTSCLWYKPSSFGDHQLIASWKTLGNSTLGLAKVYVCDWKVHFWLPDLRFYRAKKFPTGRWMALPRNQASQAPHVWKTWLWMWVAGEERFLQGQQLWNPLPPSDSGADVKFRQECAVLQAYLFTQFFARGVVWAQWLSQWSIIAQ